MASFKISLSNTQETLRTGSSKEKEKFALSSKTKVTKACLRMGTMKINMLY